MAKALSEMTQVEARVETDILYARLAVALADRKPILFAAALGRWMGENVEDVGTFMETLTANAAQFIVCECPNCCTRH
jgi:hypothetical protein